MAASEAAASDGAEVAEASERSVAELPRRRVKDGGRGGSRRSNSDVGSRPVDEVAVGGGRGSGDPPMPSSAAALCGTGAPLRCWPFDVVAEDDRGGASADVKDEEDGGGVCLLFGVPRAMASPTSAAEAT